MDMEDYSLPTETLDEAEERQIWDELIALRGEQNPLNPEDRDPVKTNRIQTLRDRLIENYAPLVWQTAERIAAKLPSFVCTDDLIGWGNLGLMDAIERYDTAHNTRFSTYCSTRISGHIIDELRRLDWTPRLVRLRTHHLERTREELRNKFGREPDDEEMADSMGISEEEYDAMVRETQPRTVVSLNRRRDEDDTNEIGKIELMPDRNAVDPLTELQRAEIKEVAIRGLNDDQKKVLLMYYYDELNMKEIGEILGLSESRVCQIHAQTIKFLKEKLADRKLMQLV